MAERQYTIVIRNQTESGGAGQKVGGAGGVKNAKGGTATQESGSKKKTKTAGEYLEKTVKGVMTYSTVANIVDTVWSHNNSLIEVRTGSKEMQERTTYKYNLGKSLVGGAIGGAIAGGAYTVGNIYGIAAGAIIGFVSAGIQHASSVAMQNQTIAENARVENAQRWAATQRVTVSGSRHMNAAQM